VPDVPVVPVVPVVCAEAPVHVAPAPPAAVDEVETAEEGGRVEPAADLPAAEEPPPGDVAPTDFWTCAAFELEIPEGGFGVSASPAAPGGASRRKRHRRRKPAPTAPAP
jgi:hypothetical protein